MEVHCDSRHDNHLKAALDVASSLRSAGEDGVDGRCAFYGVASNCLAS